MASALFTLALSDGLHHHSSNVAPCQLDFDFLLLGRVRGQNCNSAGINLVGTNKNVCNLHLHEQCVDVQYM